MIALLNFLGRSSRWVLLASIAAGVASGVTGVATIAAIQSELGRDSPGPRWLAALFAGLCLASALARVLAQVMMVRLGQGAVAEITRRLSARVLELPLRSFESMDRSRLLVVLTEDIALIGNALVGVPQLCINGPIVVACLAYVGWLSPPVLLCGLVVATLAVWAYTVASTRGMDSLRAARAEQDNLVGQLRVLVEGFRELKLHRGRRRAFLAEGIWPATAGVERRTSEGLAWFAVANGWGQLMFFGFIGLVLFAFPSAVAIDRRSLISIALVVLYLMVPLDVILNWLPVLGRGGASLHRVDVVMNAFPPRSLDLEGPADLAGSRWETFMDFESIELDGVGFAYGDGFTLGPVDLTIRRGELVFLTGGNGSGKTTLIKLIAGLYEPDGGVIRVDGRRVDGGGIEAYRGLFSVVHADGHLFRDLLGLDGEDLELQAIEGLARLQLDDEVTLVDRRFSTLDLSQGRRRRLALLGALLERRPVCVLDEWAANQDPRSKAAFYRELLPEWKAAGKTLVVISHDDAYFDVADRVVRLGDGQVAGISSPLVNSGMTHR